MNTRQTYFDKAEIEILRRQLNEGVDRAKAARAGQETPIHPRIVEQRKAKVLAEAIDVLGSKDSADEWLDSPNPKLDGVSPSDILRMSGGLEIVGAALSYHAWRLRLDDKPTSRIEATGISSKDDHDLSGDAEALAAIPRTLTGRDIAEIRHDINRKTDTDRLTEAFLLEVHRAIVFHTARYPQTSTLNDEGLSEASDNSEDPGDPTHTCVACGAARFANGSFRDSCGDPCSFFMGKGGSANPEWGYTPDGARTNPTLADGSDGAPIRHLAMRFTGGAERNSS